MRGWVLRNMYCLDHVSHQLPLFSQLNYFQFPCVVSNTLGKSFPVLAFSYCDKMPEKNNLKGRKIDFWFTVSELSAYGHMAPWHWSYVKTEHQAKEVIVSEYAHHRVSG